jgi:putative PIN family toxin of toxin-antitoxin system
MKIVVDTNVLVSALLSPFRAPARVLDLVLVGEVQPVFDDRMMAEYREVLHRPKFAFDRRSVDDLLTYLELTGQPVLALPLPISLPDVNDVMFVEVAAATKALLITGNLRHFPPDQCVGVQILSPGEFLDGWQRFVAARQD